MMTELDDEAVSVGKRYDKAESVIASTLLILISSMSNTANQPKAHENT